MHARDWTAHLPTGTAASAVDLAEGWTLPASWAATWRAAPSARVLWCAGRWTTAAELDERSAAVAGRLSRAGVRPGDRVLVSAEASTELVVAHVAALRLGLVVVPVNTAYRAREVAHVVADAGPAAAIVDDPERAAWVADASPGAVVVAGPDVALPDGEPVALDTVGPEAPAMLCYTSGTTGVPKGAVLTHRNVLAGGHAVRIAWRWDAGDRLVLALPLFHMHGLGVGLHGTLLAGASAVLLPRFDVGAVLDAARAHDATLYFGVPTMYARLAASPRLGELRRLRLCVSGSAPLPADLHAAIARGAGQRVLERYGMTETLMNVSNPYDGERRPGSVGFPLPGVELRLASAGEGAPDEILVRGPNVFPGYWHRPDATRDAFVDDGWFRTGDVGAVDDDGYVRIVGRAKELIITGGFNVYPREVEDVLRSHPGVVDVAVVGRPSDEWGEVVVAAVVADGPIDSDALLAAAAEQLAPYKRPREVVVVDELPRNALGKVLREELVRELSTPREPA